MMIFGWSNYDFTDLIMLYFTAKWKFAEKSGLAQNMLLTCDVDKFIFHKSQFTKFQTLTDKKF